MASNSASVVELIRQKVEAASGRPCSLRQLARDSAICVSVLSRIRAGERVLSQKTAARLNAVLASERPQ